MADRDFFDEDLVKQRDGVKRIKMGPADQPARTADPDANRDTSMAAGLTDLNLTRMVRQKEEVAEQAAESARELERLRQRQNDLELQKKDLEILRGKQTDYEQGKRELTQHMSQSVILLEKKEVQAEQLTELLAGTRKRFRDMLAELDDINEEHWPDESFRDELGKALVRIDDMRMEFNKAMARVDTATQAAEGETAEHAPVVFEESRRHYEPERGFGYWLKVGLAISIPIMIFVCLVLAIVFLVIYPVYI